MNGWLLTVTATWGIHLAGVLVEAAIKSTLLLAAAFLAAGCLRRQSAAVRHLIWVCALAGMMILPVLSVVLPGWNVLPAWMGPAKVEAAPEVSPMVVQSSGYERSSAAGRGEARMVLRPKNDGGVMAEHPAKLSPVPVVVQAPAAFDWAGWIAWAWGAGAIVCLMPVVVGMYLMRLRRRQGTELAGTMWRQLLMAVGTLVEIQRRVGLVKSKACGVPMTFGVVRPTILVSADAEEWPEEKRRIVLLHEMAHVKRLDCLALLLAELVRGLYWFHPLAWLAAARVRAECERACDDVVLEKGTKGSAYAAALLEYAAVEGGVPAGALAMARRSTLEGRLLAIMDVARNRRGLTRAVMSAIVGVATGAVVMVASLHGQTADSTANPTAGKQAATTAAITMDLTVATDYSTPQKAALTILDAQRHGDWHAFGKGLQGSSAAQWRETAALRAMRADWSLNAAALERFGAREDRFSDSYMPVEIFEDIVKAFASEGVETTLKGDQATVSATVKHAGAEGAAAKGREIKWEMVRVEGLWKKMVEADDKSERATLRDEWKARLFTKLAADIRAGKYQTIKEAAKARDTAFQEGPPNPPTELQKRYSHIFEQLDEKRDGGLRIESLAKQAANGDHEAEVFRLMLVEQQRLIVAAWNSIEAAAEVVAVRHGQNAVIPDDVPKIPDDFSKSDIREIVKIINARMVIPLDDKMAGEVVEAANAAYAKEKRRVFPATAPATEPPPGSMKETAESHGELVRMKAEGKVMDVSRLRVTGKPVVVSADEISSLDPAKGTATDTVAEGEAMVESVNGKLRMTSRLDSTTKDVRVNVFGGVLTFYTGDPLDLKTPPGGDAVLALSAPLLPGDGEKLDMFMQKQRTDLITKFGSPEKADDALMAQGSSLKMELAKTRAAKEKELYARWTWENMAGTSWTFRGRVYQTKTGTTYLRTDGTRFPRDIMLEGELPDAKPGQFGSVGGIIRVRDHKVTEEEIKALSESKDDQKPRELNNAKAGDMYREFYVEKPRWKAAPAHPATQGARTTIEADGVLDVVTEAGEYRVHNLTVNQVQGAVVRGFDKDGKKTGELAAGEKGLKVNAVGKTVRVTSGDEVLEAARVEISPKGQ